MTRSNDLLYRIGIDVGSNSVGIAAVEYESDGTPLRVLSAVSHIHDGGMDPSTGKSPRSRLATSGVARRTRRLVRNRRRRLVRLDDLLRENGFPIRDSETGQTLDAWSARDELSRKYVEDDAERLELLALAIRHIARHRGWRNPWLSFERLLEEPSPTKELAATIAQAEQRFGVSDHAWSTLGQLVAKTAGRGVATRPRTADDALARGSEGPVISQKVMQADSLAELGKILDTQRTPTALATAVCHAVFQQNKPHVPQDRVGRDQLPGMRKHPRAATASLEFQEYRIRAAVANLRVHSGHAVRILSPDEHDLVCEKLTTWREDDSPRWLDVADWLGIPARSLVKPSLEDGGLAKAPIDRTSRAIEKAFKPKSPVGVWWDAADLADRRALISLITDAVTSVDNTSTRAIELLESWTDEDLTKLETLKLDSGRAAYSLESLRRLNDVMSESKCDAHTARKAAFSVPDGWQPPGATFDDQIEHPTVNRVNALVRRFLTTAVGVWGVPTQVTVEHVRDAFFGPAARAEFERELLYNTRANEKVAAELVNQGLLRPRRSDIRRHEAIQRQNGMCLYCGSAVGMSNSEMDHIIADSLGGSNRRSNLVAVCRQCNAEKGNLPFAVFAVRANRPGVSADDSQIRLKAWNKEGMTNLQFKRLKVDVARRLGLEEDPEPQEERSIESTAYAAREMRERVGDFLAKESTRRGLATMPTVSVYEGTVTSHARRAGGFDDTLRLRGKDAKSRYDRRHHAIDAAVMTTINPGVAKTLRERATLKRANDAAGNAPKWKEYRGATPGAMATFDTWASHAATLARLLRTEVDADRVAVVRPLRLRPTIGAVHKSTIEPLHQRHVNDEFAPEELLRVCDRRLFVKLSGMADTRGALTADPGRAQALGLDGDGNIAMFPSNSGYLKVRGGAAALADTVRHARVYAWPTKLGYGFGHVRMYSGEFPMIGFSKPGIDIMTEPLPAWSQTMRSADPKLRRRIAGGEAKQIGWITIDDETEIDPTAFLDGDAKLARFLRSEPESRWIVTGFFGPTTMSLAPALLASEGVGSETPQDVAAVLAANRIPLAVNVILGHPGTTVIRRTVLGRVRWTDGSLPRSWKPLEAAAKAFDE
jgi:CRISPR-associated endonuclease Csn1